MEAVNLTKCEQHWPRLDSFYLAWIDLETLTRDDVSQEKDMIDAENTLTMCCI